MSQYLITLTIERQRAVDRLAKQADVFGGDLLYRAIEKGWPLLEAELHKVPPPPPARVALPPPLKAERWYLKLVR